MTQKDKVELDRIIRELSVAAAPPLNPTPTDAADLRVKVQAALTDLNVLKPRL